MIVEDICSCLERTAMASQFQILNDSGNRRGVLYSVSEYTLSQPCQPHSTRPCGPGNVEQIEDEPRKIPARPSPFHSVCTRAIPIELAPPQKCTL